MRKIVVHEMMSLDGVIQGPGNPEEDTSDGFQYGGWVAPYGDEVYDKVVSEELKSADLLLGRKTYDIWAAYWPSHGYIWPGINDVAKYVMSTTVEKSDWNNCTFISSLEDIKKFRSSEPSPTAVKPDIHVWGSSGIVQLLLKHDMVDELRLKIHPVILGKGKRLFDSGSMPAALMLTESFVTSTGVIIACYNRAGEVKTGRMSE